MTPKSSQKRPRHKMGLSSDHGTHASNNHNFDQGASTIYPTESDPLLPSVASYGNHDIHEDSRSLTSHMSITMETADSTLDDNFEYYQEAEIDESDLFEENPSVSETTTTPPSHLSPQILLRGRLTLLLVAFLFGSFNVVLRLLYALPGPPSASVLSATRGWIAAVCFTPALWSMSKQQQRSSSQMKHSNILSKKKKPIWMAAGELALWNFGALAFLNVGLLWVASARASFLTQTSVVFTPLISSWSGQRVGRTVWAGCFAALVGLVLLSDKGKRDAHIDDDDFLADNDQYLNTNHPIWSAIESVLSCLSFSTGDLLVLAGALSWSLYIFRLSSIGHHYKEIPLQALKTLLIALLYTVWVLASAIRCNLTNGREEITEMWQGWRSWQAWALLTFSAVGTGALADVLQQYGQKMVSASEANILLCVEPVFTMMLGRLLLGENTSATEKLGGMMIIIAASLASI